MLPIFAKAEGLPYSNREGWLTGSFHLLVNEKVEAGKDENLIELGVCVPVPQQLAGCRREIDGAVFYGYCENLNTPEVYDGTLVERFLDILEDFKPDMVHIFGTEFPHSLAMVRAFQRPERTLVGIQGLCCAIADSYMAELPYKVQRARTFRDRVRHDSLKEQQKKFRLRAENERSTIQEVLHITGRTGFDREGTSAIHPEAIYHLMNETLRPEFYEGRWDLNGVEPHSIFISQGDYPLKGFHFVLQAMPKILKEYPDAKLYVAGKSIIGNVGGRIPAKKLPSALWITAYGKYLKKLIREGNLEGHVIMLGSLNVEEMKAQFLRSHVFVCPSVMENSPNSLCEAMLLGMPVAAARVGGIGDLVENGAEGLLFSEGDYEALAEDVCNLFENNQFACRLASAAHKEAMIRHNPHTNYLRLLEIYRSICQ